MWRNVLRIDAGSFIGGALRYLVSLLLNYHSGFPRTSFVVNVIRCFVIGLLCGLFNRSEQWFTAEIPSKKGFRLVGCTIAHAFSFENFELGHKDTLINNFPSMLNPLRVSQ